MKQQILAGAVPPHWWERLKGAQFGFIAGLLVGLLMGWFFHGVISLAIRFGLLLVLLLPLIVIGWLWLRSQRAGGPQGPQGPQGPTRSMANPDTTWTTVIDVERTSPPPSRERETPPLIDVPFTNPVQKPKPNAPNDIEAELDALKRQRERGN
jgi:predicted lipid-binding transport protein (Tim44 family)